MVSAIRSQLNHVKQSYPDRLYVLSVVASPEQEAEYQADGYVNFEDPARAVIAIGADGALGRLRGVTRGQRRRITPVQSQNPREAEALGSLPLPASSPHRKRQSTAEEAVAAAEVFGFRSS